MGATVLGKAGDPLAAIHASNAMTPEDTETLFTTAGAIDPPYSLDALSNLFEHSNSLRQNVDSYATNIDGFGHRFEPVIDFDDTDADDRIAEAMYEERALAVAEGRADMPEAGFTPTPAEVSAAKEELARAMRIEKTRLTRHFDTCCEDMSFVTLRRRLRQDHEQLGNAYMEVLRNRGGEISEYVYIPAYTVRICRLDPEPTPIQQKRKVTDFTYGTVARERRFRRYVQVVESRAVMFKEFGDPRIISRRTGRAFGSVEELLAADPTDGPATEVLHFKVASSRSVYGIPRWIGNLLSVLGSRQAEEVNNLYFDNKGVPPLAVLISGGRIAPAAVKRLEDFIENEIKGRQNFHKILIIEAEAMGSSMDSAGTAKIDLRPLTDAQQKDGLFLQYDERNMDKVGMAFRLPRLLRGDIRDFNRASAEAALEFAEQQVFQPEREEFDFMVNRRLLPELGVRFWKFKSNAPSLRDPMSLAEVIAKLVTANVLTPEEARELTEMVFNRELKNIDAPWVKQPVALTLAGMVVADGALPQPYTGDDLPVATERAAPSAEAPQVTRTALGSIITVNEARTAHGMAPKTLPDGTPDPDGNLTIAEYQARLAAKLNPPPALASGGGATTRAGYSVADLLRGDGLPTGVPKQAALEVAPPPADPVQALARQLLQLRHEVAKADKASAEAAFLAAKREEMLADDTLTPAVVAAHVPLEALTALGLGDT